MTDKEPPQLTDSYSKHRTITVTTAAFILLGLYYPVSLPETIPVIGISITDKNLALLALALIEAYQLLRMVVEWCNSSSERRATLASKFDFAVAALISGSSLALWAIHYFDFKMPSDFSYSLAIILLGYSTLLGACISSMLFSLNFIRSKTESLRSGLPRTPVATRAAIRLSCVVLTPLLLFWLASPLFSVTMRNCWLIFALTPTFLMIVTEVIAFLTKKVRLKDGSYRSRKEHLKLLQKAFDTHDSHYQVGGWDRPVKAEPTDLYRACENDDLELIKELLSQGASPDKSEHIGWTPLMIAVAQGHETAAYLLLQAGANPNVYNNHGRTPLML